MNRIPIERSSMVVSVGYSVEDEVLEVEFPDHRLYQYYGVPHEMAEALVKSESVGRYLHKFVKPNFRCEQVEWEESGE